MGWHGWWLRHWDVFPKSRFLLWLCNTVCHFRFLWVPLKAIHVALKTVPHLFRCAVRLQIHDCPDIHRIHRDSVVFWLRFGGHSVIFLDSFLNRTIQMISKVSTVSVNHDNNVNNVNKVNNVNNVNKVNKVNCISVKSASLAHHAIPILRLVLHAIAPLLKK